MFYTIHHDSVRYKFIIRPFFLYFYNLYIILIDIFTIYPSAIESFSKINTSRGIYTKIFLQYPISVQKGTLKHPIWGLSEKIISKYPAFYRKAGSQLKIFLHVPLREISISFLGQEWGPGGRFFSMYPAPQPHQYYSPVMPHQIYYLLSPTDAAILLHTTDATIYGRPALLTKIEQGTYITFDASAPVLICLNTSYLNTSLVFCPGKGPSFFSHVPSHRDQTYAL